MEYNNFSAQHIISYQRYGLDNHLNWLINGKPGGNSTFFEVFLKSNKKYIQDLENCNITDTVIFIGKSEKSDIK